jgi:hypothetical protein
MYQVVLFLKGTGKLECAVSSPIPNLYETLERVKVARKLYCGETYHVGILRYK